MNILLVTPSSETSAGREIGNMYPIGLGYLGTVLENKGYDVNVLDYSNIDWDNAERELSEVIKTQNPRIVGISCMVTNRTSSFKLAKLVKKIDPKITVVMGGVHPTTMFKQVINHYSTDFVVVGEGEITLLELVNAIENKWSFEKLKKINGLVFKYNGQIIVNEPRPKMTNEQLDALPIFKHEYFKKKIDQFGIVFIITSRGCPFNCSFCSSSQYWGRLRRQRNAENVFSEIKYVKERFPNMKRIYFADDEFLCDKKRIIEVCKKIVKEDIKIAWECQARITSIDEEIVGWLKKAGCDLIYFGIESGSQRILNNVNKKVTIEQMIKAIEIVKKYGIRIGPNLMIGLPGENKESVAETIKFLKRIKVYGEPSILQVYPATDICEMSKKKGFLTDDYWLTDKLVPLYTYENSKYKLLFWSAKISYFSKWNSEGFIEANRWLLKKIRERSSPMTFFKFFKRYISKRY